MGGDCIGFDLVPLSTGQDFVGMVVDTAAGNPPVLKKAESHISAIRFLMNENDLRLLENIRQNHPQNLKKVVLEGDVKTANITDSGSRPGFFILQADPMKKWAGFCIMDHGKIRFLSLIHRSRDFAIQITKIHFL